MSVFHKNKDGETVETCTVRTEGSSMTADLNARTHEAAIKAFHAGTDSVDAVTAVMHAHYAPVVEALEELVRLKDNQTSPTYGSDKVAWQEARAALAKVRET